MEKGNVYVSCIEGANSTSLSKRASEFLDLFLEQFLCSIIYAVVCFASSAVLSRWPAVSAAVTLILYAVLLGIILLISIRDNKKGVMSNYGPREKTVLFQLHLLLFGVGLILFGLITDNGTVAAIGLTHLALLLGFAISLNVLFSSSSATDFKARLKSEYMDLRVSKAEICTICLAECIIFTVSCAAPAFPWVFVPLVVLVIIAAILDVVRKKRIFRFLKRIDELVCNANILIARLGEENVLYNKLLRSLNTDGDKCKQEWDKVANVDFVIILNNLINKNEEAELLSQFLKCINSKTTIIDPSVNSEKWKKSILFSWFSMPCLKSSECTTEEYKKFINSNVINR